MKKIVAAVAAGLILAGAAFADVSFSWKRTNIVGGTSKKFDSVKRSDCLGLELSNDIAGVVFDWDIEDEVLVYKKGTDLKDKLDGTKLKDEIKIKTTNKLALDSYYGWMTFGLPVGNLQVTSGKWSGRYADRVKTDAGDLDADYYEAYKLGVINGVGAADSDNLTEGNMATVLAYTLADSLPGTLLVKAGIVNFGDEYGKFDSQSGFVAEVGYRQEGLFNVNVAVKSPIDKATVFSAFVSPLMVENLRATVGFTMGNYDGDSEFAIDARARYAVTEKTAVTGMFNYSSISKELGRSASDKHADDDLNKMWTMLSVNHVAGDNIRFLATLQNTVKDFVKSGDEKYLTAFTPACEITVSEKAVVTAAFDMRWDGKTPYAGLGDVSLPIYVTLSL